MSKSINFTQMDFPSDRLTVKQLRMAFPHSYDVEVPYQPDPQYKLNFFHGRKSVAHGLGEVINCERLIGAIAFKAKLGLPLTEDEELTDRREIIDELAEFYVKLGLTQGLQHAKQQIRHIEAQAEAQAGPEVGPSTSR